MKLLRQTVIDAREARPFYRRDNDHVGKSFAALLPNAIISASGLGTCLVYQATTRLAANRRGAVRRTDKCSVF